MEIQQLRYFLAIADEGGFTKAATACNVAQPSLSQQIAKLESELGTPLFSRLGRRVELTDAGHAVLPPAREIVAALERIRQAAHATSTEIAGEIQIGTVSTISQFMLPNAVRQFTSLYPQVSLKIHEDNRRALVERVVIGELDIALLSREMEHDALQVLPIFDEDFQLVVPRRHRLHQQKNVCIGDLHDERFVLLEQGAGLPNLIQQFCRAHGFDPTISCRTAQIATVQAMVSAGLGISFVPRMAAAADSETTRTYITLIGDTPARTIALAWHRKRYQSLALRKFIALLRETAHPT